MESFCFNKGKDNICMPVSLSYLAPIKCSYNIKEIKKDIRGNYFISHTGKEGLSECADFSLEMNNGKNKAALDALLKTTC